MFGSWRICWVICLVGLIFSVMSLGWMAGLGGSSLVGKVVLTVWSSIINVCLDKYASFGDALDWSFVQLHDQLLQIMLTRASDPW